MKQLLLTAIAVSSLLWGCGKSNDTPPPRGETPRITPTTLTLKEGEQATATVANATEVAVVKNDYTDIFAIETEGLTIIARGLKPGEGAATIKADDSLLTLRVTVTGKSNEDEYDFSAELADNRTRFVSERVAIAYDTPGTIVSRRADGTVEMRDLSNGNHIEFAPGGDTEGSLTGATLSVNGEAARIEECSLEWKASESDRWYRITTAGSSRPIVLVVTGL